MPGFVLNTLKPVLTLVAVVLLFVLSVLFLLLHQSASAVQNNTDTGSGTESQYYSPLICN
jgi:hypothetical protein